MKRCFLGIVILILVVVPVRNQSKPTTTSSPQLKTQKAFFKNLRKMCGKRFEGKTEFPQNADHPMVGKKLVMSVGPCAEKEIRIPFQVGEDKSRTWILTLGENGLLFKHDHRHPDGTPDQITMYGGWAAANGTPYLQRFPADPDTVKLIPEAATNVWTLQIIPEKQRFMYYLERNNQPRYRAYFDLKTPLPASRRKAGALHKKSFCQSAAADG